MTKNKEKECHMHISMMIIKHTQVKEDVQNVVIHNIQRHSDVQLVSTNAEIVTNMVTSVACATRIEKHLTREILWDQDHPKHITTRLA